VSKTATRIKLATGIAAAASLTIPAAPAEAQSVIQFTGIVVPSCILTVSTPGLLGVSTNSGTELGSELPGGNAAVLAVIATAGAPTIQFTAPTMSAKPAGYSGSPTISIKYTSTGGASQAYTTASSHYTSSSPLGDTVTVNAKADDAAGFPAGTYQVQTTATCQQ